MFYCLFLSDTLLSGNYISFFHDIKSMFSVIRKIRRLLSLLAILALGVFVSVPQAKWFCVDGDPCSASCSHPTAQQSRPVKTAMATMKRCCPMCRHMVMTKLTNPAQTTVSSGFCYEVVSNSLQTVNPEKAQIHFPQIASTHVYNLQSTVRYTPVFAPRSLNRYESPPHEIHSSRAPPFPLS